MFKLALRLLTSPILFLLTIAGSAQPSNDAFFNRVFLPEGDGFVETAFWASLQGTTLEQSDPTQTFAWKYSTAGSAWWSWTAYKTGFAVVEEISNQQVVPFPTFAVYTGHGLPSLTELNWYDEFTYSFALTVPRRLFLGFKTTVGQTYSFGLIGDPSSKTLLQFVLKFSDSPIITGLGPNQLAAAGDGAFFAVASPSLPDGHVQWQFNSEDIPNETNSVLTLFNVGPARSGQYRAIVEATNSDGVLKRTISYYAQLAVQGEITSPQLSVRNDVSAGRLSARILGQSSQSYSVDSTQDFVAWQSEQIATADIEGQVELPLPLNSTPTARFFRLRHLGHLQRTCTMNLNRIKFAKEMLRLAHKRNVGAEMQSDDEISRYLGEVPTCPQGGVYTLGPFGKSPVCSLEALGHEVTFW